MKDGKLQWHPAFSAALRIELEDELDKLTIEEEHLLGSKPMQMDVLIIKKDSNSPIHKNIGRIFRKHNIIEYKSPDDYLSINDFYKVYGYACFYQADTDKIMEINPEEITITFVASHYPRKMLQHIVHTKKINIIKKENGIYYLENSMFPMQLLVVNELSKEENYWLQSLRNNISTNHEMIDLLEHYEKKRYIKWYDAVMDVIIMANRKQIKEESKMSEALNELCEELLADKIKNVREEGKEEGIELAKKILKLFQSNTPTDKIAQQCGISQEQVLKILE